MALWNPDHGAVQPRVFIDFRRAVWSGSNLVSLQNRGTEGGDFGLNGTPVKGDTFGSHNAIRINANSQYLSLAMRSFSAGSIYVFAVFRLNNLSAAGLVGGPGTWGSGNTTGIYAHITGGDGAFAFGNGWTPSNPWFETQAAHNISSTSAWYSRGYLLGSTLEERLNGTSYSSFDGSGTGNTPAYGAGTWKFGNVDPTFNLEGLDGDLCYLLLYDSDPGTTIKEQLEGWALWDIGQEGQLVSGHAYESAAPERGTTDDNATNFITNYASGATTSFQNALHGLALGLKDDGDWNRFDWLLLPADTSSGALRNFRNQSKAATNISSTAFTAYEGFTGDGSADHLDLGERWDASGANVYGLNSAHIGYVVRTANGGTAIRYQVGNDVNAPRTQGTSRDGSGNSTFRINDSTDSTAETSPGIRTGHHIINRPSSATKNYWRNGTKRSGDLSVAATSVNTSNGVVLRSQTNYSPDQISLVHSGGGLTDEQAARISSRIDTFLSDMVAPDEVEGTLALTDGADTVASAGTTTVVGALATTDGADTLASAGSVGPPKVILDTDMEGDNDDVVALALLIHAHHAGLIELVAVIVTSGLQTSAPAVRAFLKAYGLGGVPVGYKIRTGGINPDRFAGAVRDMFGGFSEQANGGGYDTSTTVYRQALADHDDVKIITIGPLDALSDLLDSTSDGIYAGSGVALVTAKADLELLSMGGQGASTGTEFNVSDNATATDNVLDKWPGTILFHPFQIGDSIYSRINAANEPSRDPMKYAWDASSTLTSAGGVTGNRPAGWRESWDPCTVFDFIDSLADTPVGYFGRSGQGTYTINTGNGQMSWSADGTGPHRYATTVESDGDIQDAMELVLNALAPPVSVNLIRQSAVHPHTSLAGVTSVGTFSSSQNTDVAPDNATTADTITGSGLGASVHHILAMASKPYTFSIRVKKTTSRTRFLAVGIEHRKLDNTDAGSAPNEVGFTVNTNNGTAYAASGWAGVTVTGVDCFEDPDDSDYWVAVMRWTTKANTAKLFIYVMPNGGDSATSGTRANTGGPTSQVVWGMQVEPASNYTALMPTAGAPEFEPGDQVVTVTGALTVTDGTDTVSSAGTHPAVASLSATDGTDTLASAGSHPAVGTLSATDGADTVGISGSPIVSGTASITDGADTTASAGTHPSVGTLSATDAADTVAATGSPVVVGSASLTDGGDTLSANGSSQIAGSLDVTDGADTVAAAGTHPSLGSSTITDGSDTLASAGTVGTEEEVTGSATITDGADTLSAAGTHPAVGSSSLTDGADSIAASGSPVVAGALAITDGTDTAASSGTHPSVGSLSATDGGDAILSFGTVGTDETVVGYLVVTDGADTVSASGVLTVVGGLSSTDGADTVASEGYHPAVGSASLTDGADSVSSTGWPVVVGTVAANDNADTLSATGSDGTGLGVPKGRTSLLVGPMTTTVVVGRATITRLA